MRIGIKKVVITTTFFLKVLVCFFKVQKRLCCFDFECKGTAFRGYGQ